MFGRNSVESGLKQTLKDRNHSLDSEFVVKEVEMKKKPKKKKDENTNSEEDEELLDEFGLMTITKPLVVVKKLDHTIAEIMLQRQLTPGWKYIHILYAYELNMYYYVYVICGYV